MLSTHGTHLPDVNNASLTLVVPPTNEEASVVLESHPMRTLYIEIVPRT